MRPNPENVARAEAWGASQRALREAAKDDPTTGAPTDGYVMRVLLALDQLGNAVFGGDPDETISSRIGRAKLRGDLNAISGALDVLLNFLDENHSVDAIEWDERGALEDFGTRE